MTNDETTTPGGTPPDPVHNPPASSEVTVREIAAMDLLLKERRRAQGISEDGETSRVKPVLVPRIQEVRKIPTLEGPSDEEREQLERRKRWKALVADRGQRYGQCRLENFQCDVPAQRKVVASLQKYSQNLPHYLSGGHGVVLYGPPGTGKDHLAMAICREILGAGFTVAWFNGMDLFGRIRDAITDGEPERKLVQAAVKPDVLYLSDPLPPAGDLEKFQASTLFRIVDARYSRGKPCIVTANVKNSDEMGARLGVQTTERLKHGALCLHCQWPSKREAMELS